VLPLVAAGTGVAAMVGAAAVANLRFVVYSAVLARHLLGERFFRDWQAALAKANAEAARHESDIVLSR